MDAVRTNVVLTALTRSTITVHVPVPPHAPDQRANLHPAAGEAVSLTGVPARYASQQSAPHLIPRGALVTMPDPVFVTDSENDEAGSKNAMTDAARATVVVQLARAPEHAPPHPVKLALASGRAVRVTLVPALNE